MASPPPDPEKRALELRAATAELAKKTAEAELAAFKLRFGDVPASGMKGDVTIGTNAGAIEAHLLCALSAREAAQQLVRRLGSVAKKKIAVISASELAGFQQCSTLLFAAELMRAARENAIKATPSSQAARGAPPATITSPIAALGLGLDALSKIAGYFRADYSISGTDTTPDEPLFVAAVAETLVEGGASVFVPSLRLPSIGSPVLDLMKELVSMQTEAAERAGACDLAAKDPAKTSDAPTNTAARDAWKVVSTLYDTFVGKLTVPDAAGRLPLANLAAEIALRDFIKSGMLLVLKPHRLGGSFVTRKTLWTLLGTNPFTVAGGALLSCALFDGSGNMTHAAILPALSEHYPLNHVKLKIDYEMYLAAR